MNMSLEKVIYFLFVSVIGIGLYLTLSSISISGSAQGIELAFGLLTILLGVMGIMIRYIFRDTHTFINENAQRIDI